MTTKRVVPLLSSRQVQSISTSSPSSQAAVGPFIEVTGIDGAGKSTLVSHLATVWNLKPRKVRPFTEQAVLDDGRVAGQLGQRAAESFRACLLAAELLRTAATLDEPTVFDRYVESARMWWTVKHVQPLPEQVLRVIPPPDLVVFVEVPVEIGIARRVGTSERSLEAEREFLTQCRDYLRERAARSASWITIDGTAPLADVLEAGTSALVKTLCTRE